jgi:hypothetical protein
VCAACIVSGYYHIQTQKFYRDLAVYKSWFMGLNKLAGVCAEY